MAKEVVTPAQKPVPTSGGVKDGGNSTLTTPKKETDRYWAGKEGNGKLMSNK